MIDGDSNIEYGSAAFRADSWLARFTGGGDGRTILALNSGRLDAIDATTGVVTRGPRIATMVPAGDAVAVATKAEPAAVTLLALPGLTARAEFGAGGKVYRIAVGGPTVAALTSEAECDDFGCRSHPQTPHERTYALALIVDGVTRRVDLPQYATCAAVSPDGTLVALGTDRGRTGNVLVVDVATGTIRHTLTGPRAPVTAVVVSAEHDLVAAAAGPRVFGWRPSLAKPKAASLWTAAKEATSLAGITPAGRLIAFAEKAAIAAIDPVAGTADWEIDAYGPALVAGDRVLSSRFHVCRELDPATGAVLHSWTHPGFAGNLSLVGATAVGSGLDSRPMLFRPGATDIPVLGDGHSRTVVALAFDGDRFASGGLDDRVCVWRRGDPVPVFSVLLGDWPGGRHRHHGVALDGDMLLAGVRDVLVRFTVGDPEPLARSAELDGDVVAVASMPDRGEVLAACSKGYRNGTLYRLDARTLEVRAKAKADRVWGAAIVYTPGAKTFELRWPTGFRAHEVSRLRDAGGNEVPAGRPHVFLTPDQALSVYLDNHRDDAAMRILDVAARTRVYEPITIPLMSGEPCMSSAGQLTTGHADAIRLWDPRAGTLVREVPLTAPPGFGSALYWTPGEQSIMITRSSGGIEEVPITG